jgi:hypothetical protein
MGSSNLNRKAKHIYITITIEETRNTKTFSPKTLPPYLKPVYNMQGALEEHSPSSKDTSPL